MLWNHRLMILNIQFKAQVSEHLHGCRVGWKINRHKYRSFTINLHHAVLNGIHMYSWWLIQLLFGWSSSITGVCWMIIEIPRECRMMVLPVLKINHSPNARMKWFHVVPVFVGAFPWGFGLILASLSLPRTRPRLKPEIWLWDHRHQFAAVTSTLRPSGVVPLELCWLVRTPSNYRIKATYSNHDYEPSLS